MTKEQLTKAPPSVDQSIKLISWNQAMDTVVRGYNNIEDLQKLALVNYNRKEFEDARLRLILLKEETEKMICALETLKRLDGENGR